MTVNYLDVKNALAILKGLQPGTAVYVYPPESMSGLVGIHAIDTTIDRGPYDPYVLRPDTQRRIDAIMTDIHGLIDMCTMLASDRRWPYPVETERWAVPELKSFIASAMNLCMCVMYELEMETSWMYTSGGPATHSLGVMVRTHSSTHTLCYEIDGVIHTKPYANATTASFMGFRYPVVEYLLENETAEDVYRAYAAIPPGTDPIAHFSSVYDSRKRDGRISSALFRMRRETRPITFIENEDETHMNL